MAGTYFDAVVNRDTIAVFNGTPEETVKFLEANPKLHRNHEVVVGTTLRFMTVTEYLRSRK